jgi:hypothetical protein
VAVSAGRGCAGLPAGAPAELGGAEAASPALTPASHAGAASSAGAWRHYAIGTDTSSDTHDDFKPKYKEEPAGDAEATIRQDISGHDVFMYMKVGAAVVQPRKQTPPGT